MQTIMDLCFLCTKDYNCVPVDNNIVSQVECLLPEITIFKLGIPLRICSVCEGALYSFSKFKQFYLESSRRLEATITQAHAQCSKDISAQAHPPPPVDPIPLEEIIIKEEIIDDTFEDHSYTNVMQDTLKEECEINDNSESQLEHNTEGDTEEVWRKNFTDSEDETDGNCSKNKAQKNKQHRCELCNEIFAYNTLLIRHKTKHLSCDVCKKLFIHEYDLNKHMKVHTGIKNFECCICKKQFLEKRNLKRHLELHVEVKDFYCENCNDSFPLEVYINYHLTHSNMLVKETLLCTACNKSFKYKSLFDRHMKFHSGVRDFRCEICGKGFMQKYTLVTHMKSHSGVKDFHCEFCNKAFTHKFHMVAHRKTHQCWLNEQANKKDAEGTG